MTAGDPSSADDVFVAPLAELGPPTDWPWVVNGGELMAHRWRHRGVMMGQSRPGLSGEMAGTGVIRPAASRCDRTEAGHLYVLLPPPILHSRIRYLGRYR